MSKLVKGMVTEEIRKRYEGLASACVVDITGMTVQEQEGLRKVLRGKSGRMQVVKNSLARLAFKGGPLEPLGPSLSGPCAVVTANESIIDVARALIAAAKEFKALKLKKAIFEGDAQLLTVEQISKMRGRREILGELSMLISSPGRAVAGCIRAPQSKLAGCIKALADKAA